MHYKSFEWKTSENGSSKGEHLQITNMTTSHIFYTMRMIYNNSVPRENMVGNNPKLYIFGASYTKNYLNLAIRCMAMEIFDRGEESLPLKMSQEISEMGGLLALFKFKSNVITTNGNII